MEITAILIEIFGIGSLTLAFAKYTLEKRKLMNAESNMKNRSLSGKSLTNRP